MQESQKIASNFSTDLDETRTARVLFEIGQSFENFQNVSLQEASLEKHFSTSAQHTCTIPFFDEDINDLNGLSRLGQKLWS